MDMYSEIDFQNEFKNYAMKHLGVSSSQLRDWNQMQTNLYSNCNTASISNSMTPYILEERQMRVTQMDIFSRLMMDRILWLAGPVNDLMSTTVQAQLLFLSSVDKDKDITIYVDTPGGSVKSGLSMIDNMMLCAPDIRTVNTGMAASMGSLLLGAGTKGKRSSLRSSRVMLHQISSGYQGNHQDNKISFEESEKYNQLLFDYLGEFCGKDSKEVMNDATRDLWLNAEESLEYGIIDEIIIKK
jgi:ATP-dependent Clp protease protease subunit